MLATNAMHRNTLKSFVVLLSLSFGAPVVAFDGGSVQDGETQVQPPDYLSFHNDCMDIQLTMWGEVAELMADLATAHCYCEFHQLEISGNFSSENKRQASTSCYRKGTRPKKETFIKWAIPLHQRRLNEIRSE